jgi:O-antigen/teichoic acid export membrane protein
MNYLLSRILMPWVSIKYAFANKKTLKTLMAYGGVTTIIVIADMLRLNIDSAVIGKFVSLDAVGVYGVAALLIRYVIRVIAAGVGVLTPRFSNLEGAGQKEQTKNLFVKSLSISAALSFGIATCVFIFGRKFILWWVGPDYSDSARVLFILIVPMTIALAQGPGINLMYALKKHHYYAVVTSLEAIVNLTLSLILVRKYGIFGVALGTAIPMMCVKIFIQPFYVCRIMKLPVYVYLKQIFLPLVISSFVIGIWWILKISFY